MNNGESLCLHSLSGGEREHLESESPERRLPLYRANLKCGLGHSVNRAAWCVLRERVCACLAHGLQTIDAVSPHSTHDDADRMGAGDAGDRMEKNIDRWSEPVHRLFVDQPAIIAVRPGYEFEVARPRCDIDRARAERRTMCGLLDPGRREPIQTPGEALDVSGGNMLNHQHGRTICGEFRDHSRQRLCAAGSC